MTDVRSDPAVCSVCRGATAGSSGETGTSTVPDAPRRTRTDRGADAPSDLLPGSGRGAGSSDLPNGIVAGELRDADGHTDPHGIMATTANALAARVFTTNVLSGTVRPVLSSGTNVTVNSTGGQLAPTLPGAAQALSSEEI